MTTLSDRLFSSYVSRTCRGDRQAFERVQAYFEDAARFTEDAWERVSHDEGQAVFKKGKELAFTFDYRSPILEVRSIVVYDADEQTITVTVGNAGKAHLARERYRALLDKIDAYITANDIAAEATPRHVDFVRPVGVLACSRVALGVMPMPRSSTAQGGGHAGLRRRLRALAHDYGTVRGLA